MTTHILLFSDVHGRIPMMLKLACRFQRERQCKLDLILVTGDIGIWPDLQKLDQATRKYAWIEPAELGFLAFGSLLDQAEQAAIMASPEAEVIHTDKHRAYQRKARQAVATCLAEVTCPIVFIGGNHEDYDYLYRCRSEAKSETTPRSAARGDIAPRISVDQTGRLQWLPSGARFVHNGLCIAGIDGIEAEGSGRASHRYPPEMCIDEDTALQAMLALTEQSVDILLTHDGPPDAARSGKGSPLVLSMLQEIQPAHHFFGHYHAEVSPLRYRDHYDGFAQQDTWGTHINKLSFDKYGLLRPQSMLHLTHDEGKIESKFVADPWYRTIRPNNWHN